MTSVRATGSGQGVSIVTCTKRPNCMNNLFRNYARQTYRQKELIVILNDPDMELRTYERAAKRYRNVRIVRLPKATLGRCLNLGVRLSRYGCVAKFDDDDYYAPRYLADCMRTMRRTKADIVGKRAHFMFLEGSKLLLLRYYDRENRYGGLVQGATLLAKRHVFRKVAFPDKTRGECVTFCRNAAARGFTVYSANRYHFAAVRRKQSRGHTWIVSDQKLLSQNKVNVWKVRNFKRFVSRGKE